MSWFESPSWASIGSIAAKTAKTALKHAQKNIDKVLEIPETPVDNPTSLSSAEDISQRKHSVTPESEIRDETEGFFSLFGVGNGTSAKTPSKSSSLLSLQEDPSITRVCSLSKTPLSRKSSSSSLSRLRSADTWSSTELHACPGSEHPSTDSLHNGTVKWNLSNSEATDSVLLNDESSTLPPNEGSSYSVEDLSTSYSRKDDLEVALHEEHSVHLDVSQGRLEILFHDDGAQDTLEPAGGVAAEEATDLVDVPLGHLDSATDSFLALEEFASDLSLMTADTVGDSGLELALQYHHQHNSFLENDITDSGPDATEVNLVPEEGSLLRMDESKLEVPVGIPGEVPISLFDQVYIKPEERSPEVTDATPIMHDEIYSKDDAVQLHPLIEAPFPGDTVFPGEAPQISDELFLYKQEIEQFRAVLAIREQKLLDVSTESAKLKEENDNFSSQIADLKNLRPEMDCLRRDFADRLSQMDRKLQLANEEKKSLSEQLQLTKTELSNSVRLKNEASGVLAKDALRQIEEKDAQIKELMEEGEKLSKQQFQSSNHIKKLRSKQTELEAEITKLRSELDDRSNEIVALRSTIAASEELEEKQAGTIKNLTISVDRLEKDIIATRNVYDESKSKISSLQSALDSAYKELADLHRQHATQEGQVHETLVSTEIAAREELRQALEQQKLQLSRDQEELLERLEVLQGNLNRAESTLKRKEEGFREEIKDYQDRLQDATMRNEELGQNLAQATRPLLRQNETLQKQLSEQAMTFEKLEQNLTRRLQDSMTQLVVAQEKERAAVERLSSFSGKVQALETQLSIVREERQCLTTEADLVRSNLRDLEERLVVSQSDMLQLKDSTSMEILALKRDKQLAEHQAALEKENLDMERRKVTVQTDQIADLQRQLRVPPVVLSRSPSEIGPNLRRSDSVSSNHSTLDGRWSPTSQQTTSNSLYDALRGGPGPFLDSVQSQLKLKDGEVQHLKSELRQLELTRQKLSEEMLRNTEIAEEVTKLRGEINSLKTSNEDVIRRYNAMLQMYGEKAEELEEMRLDYEDMKALYKSQIDALTRKT